MFLYSKPSLLLVCFVQRTVWQLLTVHLLFPISMKKFSLKYPVNNCFDWSNNFFSWLQLLYPKDYSIHTLRPTKKINCTPFYAFHILFVLLVCPPLSKMANDEKRAVCVSAFQIPFSVRNSHYAFSPAWLGSLKLKSTACCLSIHAYFFQK